MFRNIIKGIIYITVIVILPILASFTVETITSMVTMEMIMKVVYVALGVIAAKMLKEGI